LHVFTRHGETQCLSKIHHLQPGLLPDSSNASNVCAVLEITLGTHTCIYIYLYIITNHQDFTWDVEKDTCHTKSKAGDVRRKIAGNTMSTSPCVGSAVQQHGARGPGMVYTIAAVQHLSLRFSVDAVNVDSAPLLVYAAKILRIALGSCVQPYSNLCASSSAMPGVALQNMLCTWRPRYCVDIFLYFDGKGGMIVGLPMLADEEVGLSDTARLPSQQQRGSENDGDDSTAADMDDEIRHFSPENATGAADVAECVCFAHLTCDQDDNGVQTMVALVYDVLLRDGNTLDTRQRYEYLRSISEPLSNVVVGEACVRVQWAGDPSTFDLLEALVLPHAHNSIVLYGNQRCYLRFAFDDRALCAV